MSLLEHPASHDHYYKKITGYCAYQERSYYEVSEKLKSYGLPKKETDQLMARLTDEKYINDERYARAFAGGKFRIKHWGRIKIKFALLQKKIEQGTVEKVLNDIDDIDYEKIMKKLALQKWNQLKKEGPALKKIKTVQYLVQKGFEKNLAIKALHKISGEGQVDNTIF